MCGHSAKLTLNKYAIVLARVNITWQTEIEHGIQQLRVYYLTKCSVYLHTRTKHCSKRTLLLVELTQTEISAVLGVIRWPLHPQL